MNWYELLSRGELKAFIILTFICIAFHALMIPAETDRYRKSLADRLINEGLNFVYLLYLFCVMTRLAFMASGTYASPLVTSFVVSQYVLFGLAVVFVICEVVFVENYNQLADPVFLLITLSVFERIEGYFYPGAIAALLTYFYLRSAYIIIRDRREKNNYLSFASIYEAVNSLHEGLLFCDEDGFILILNLQMRKLMLDICKKTYKNGNRFFKELSDQDSFRDVSRANLYGDLVFVVDDRVWSFSKEYISIDDKIFIQIAANDVTSLWSAMTNLKETQEKLSERSDELKSAIKNIEDMALENEMIMMKNNFHDVLGHRIALLLRNMRENKEPDEELLRSFAESFYTEIRENTSNEEQRLASIVKTMKGIDIDVLVDGNLPDVKAYAALFVDIIREAATNAVRHGFASEIDIEMDEDDSKYSLTVSNNGLLPSGDEIVERGGLGGIRRKLKSFDGSVDVSFSQRYTLTCSIPKMS